jgi:hypothetical protein
MLSTDSNTILLSYLVRLVTLSTGCGYQSCKAYILLITTAARMLKI